MDTPRTGTRCRLDELLVLRGLAESRTRAQSLIRAGDVTIDGHRSDKPGMPVRRDALITVRPAKRFVGRGGDKLEAALIAFGWDVTDRVALDVGASTGGFTDCLLQRGAHHVYAVDVGRGQLAWRLRTDPRVTCLERTDIRALETLPEAPTIAVVDVAFISLRLVLPAVWGLVAPGAGVIALVKPQFEAGRAEVGRGGVVRDPAVHRRVLHDVLRHAEEAHWQLEGGLPSPITGADGNREFLIALRRPAPDEVCATAAPDRDDVIEACLRTPEARVP
ncbi:MAG: TlyA family RNA methyltransferase [Ardenticatenales bacterium]|nr:TlyA family RNA methyltransferase [Ardenticatenales bacterium]